MRAQVQQVRHADDAHHVVQGIAAHRVPRMRAITCATPGQSQAIVHAGRGVEPLHIAARRHQRGERAFIQPEYVLHHLVLMRFYQAGVHTLL